MKHNTLWFLYFPNVLSKIIHDVLYRLSTSLVSVFPDSTNNRRKGGNFSVKWATWVLIEYTSYVKESERYFW